MRFRNFLFPVILSAAAMVVVGCGGDTSAESNTEQAATASPKVDAVTGYIDPACQMKVTPDATYRHTHDGVTYGFCGEGCKEAFKANPASFLAALEE